MTSLPEITAESKIACKRCKVDMPESFIFCVNCGQRSKMTAARQILKETTMAKQPVQFKRPTNVNNKSNNKATNRRKGSKTSHGPQVGRDHELNLPMAVLDSMSRILTTPAIGKAEEIERQTQLLRVQMLEIQNADAIEFSVLNQKAESHAIDSKYCAPAAEPRVQLTSDHTSNNENAPDTYISRKQSSRRSRRIVSSKESRKRIDSKKLIDPAYRTGYLEEVESISMYYNQYLNRVKQLEGLQAACLDPPELPSKTLSAQHGTGMERSLGDNSVKGTGVIGIQSTTTVNAAVCNSITTNSTQVDITDPSYPKHPSLEQGVAGRSDRVPATQSVNTGTAKSLSDPEVVLDATGGFNLVVDVSTMAASAGFENSVSSYEDPRNNVSEKKNGSVEGGVAAGGSFATHIAASIDNGGGSAFLWGPMFNPVNSTSADTIVITGLPDGHPGPDDPLATTRGTSTDAYIGKGTSTGTGTGTEMPYARRSHPGTSTSSSSTAGGVVGGMEGRGDDDDRVCLEVKDGGEKLEVAQEEGHSRTKMDQVDVDESMNEKFGDVVLMGQPTLQPLRERSNVESGTVMFWGDVLHQDPEDILRKEEGTGGGGGGGGGGEEDVESVATTPSALGSLVSRLNRSMTLSGDQNRDGGRGIAIMDAEAVMLSAWTEILASETAQIRHTLLEEDEEMMTRIESHLCGLEEDSLAQQTERELYVQYSMEGVLKTYRERIKEMKQSYGVDDDTILNRYKKIAPPILNEEERDARGLVEAEGMPTREESPRAEGTVYGANWEDSELAPLRRDLLAILEKEETLDNDRREELLQDDEVLMQEVILSLVECNAHNLRPRSAIEFPHTLSKSKDLSEGPVDGDENGLIALPAELQEAVNSVYMDQRDEQEARDMALRNQLHDEDDLAMQHWLVAVTSIDSQQARKQTLRTLQLEQLEDFEEGLDKDGDESIDDENSVGSAMRDGEEGAIIHVPANNSCEHIKEYYRTSISNMAAILPTLEVDFLIDQAAHSDFRTQARAKLQFARKTLKASSSVDHKVAIEYRKYLDYCATKRTAMALQIADAMQKVSKLEKSFRLKYAEATAAHKAAIDRDPTMLALTGGQPHKHPSKPMQAIQLSADLSISNQGQVVKQKQAEEAKLILDIRQEQFVLSEVLTVWQERHSRALRAFATAFQRFSGLLDSTSIPAAAGAVADDESSTMNDD